MLVNKKSELDELIKVASLEIIDFQSPLFIIESFIGHQRKLKVKAIKELLRQLVELRERARATGPAVREAIETKIAKVKKTLVCKITLVELLESSLIDEDRLTLAASALCRLCNCKREEAEELELTPLVAIALIAEEFKIVEDCTKFTLRLYEDKWLEQDIGFSNASLQCSTRKVKQQDIVEYRFNGLELNTKEQYYRLIEQIQIYTFKR